MALTQSDIDDERSLLSGHSSLSVHEADERSACRRLLCPSWHCMLQLLAVQAVTWLALLAVGARAGWPQLAQLTQLTQLQLQQQPQYGGADVDASTQPPALHFVRPDGCVMYTDNAQYPDCAPAVLPYQHVRSMTLALTSCGTAKREGAAVTIKSWLMHRLPSMDLTVYILMDDMAELPFAEQVLWWNTTMSRWPPTIVPSLTSLSAATAVATSAGYRIEWVNLNRSLSDALQADLHHFKRCAGARLYAADALSSVQRLVYVDADTVLVHEPRRLWAEFDLHNESTLLAAAWEGSGHGGALSYYVLKDRGFPFYPPYGLNSGVLLLDLDKIRRVRLQSGLSWNQEMRRLFSLYGDKLAFGDQDVLNIICAMQSALCMPLPAGYNYRVGIVEERLLFEQERGITIVHAAGGLLEAHQSIAYDIWKFYEGA